MKRKEWKIIPLLLAVLIIISAFGCGKNGDDVTGGTYTNENGEIEQYTFDGIPGDKPYVPWRDDLRDRDEKTTAKKDDDKKAAETEAPGEVVTEPSKAPAATEAPAKPDSSPTEAPTESQTESTTAKPLSRDEIMKMLRDLFKNGFTGTAEDALASIEKSLGRELTERERQAFYVVYNLIGPKGTTAPTNEDNGLPPLEE